MEQEDESGRIKLISKEGESYDVSRKVAIMSQLVKETLGVDDDDDDDDDDNDDDGNSSSSKDIPLPNVSSSVLEKVIEYCVHYTTTEEMTPIQTPLKSSKLEELVQQWYADYVKVDKDMLFDLVAAANFMDIKPLLDLTCLAVSILLKGKSAGELREMFNMPHPTTPFTNTTNSTQVGGANAATIHANANRTTTMDGGNTTTMEQQQQPAAVVVSNDGNNTVNTSTTTTTNSE